MGLEHLMAVRVEDGVKTMFKCPVSYADMSGFAIGSHGRF